MTRLEHKGHPASGAARRIAPVRFSGKDEVHLGAAVRNEDLLAIDADLAVRELGGARRDRAEVAAGLGLRQIHAALDLAGRESRKPDALELRAAEFLNV